MLIPFELYTKGQKWSLFERKRPNDDLESRARYNQISHQDGEYQRMVVIKDETKDITLNKYNQLNEQKKRLDTDPPIFESGDYPFALLTFGEYETYSMKALPCPMLISENKTEIFHTSYDLRVYVAAPFVHLQDTKYANRMCITNLGEFDPTQPKPILIYFND